MNILIISGHGAGDPGATATHKGTFYQEQDETRALSALVKAHLSPYGSVTIYPVTRNAYSDYQKGLLADNAKLQQYDYVLELHFNASAKDDGDGRVKGSEAYVTTKETGIAVEKVILEKLSALGFTNRGVKRKNWAVISQAKNAGTSSCLLETCFIDDADDMALYLKDKSAVAKAIADGIVEGFGLSASGMTVQNALQLLQEKGVINTPAYWQGKLSEVQYLDELLIKMAKTLQ